MKIKDIYGSYIKSVNAHVRQEMCRISEQPARYSAVIRFLSGNKPFVVADGRAPVCIAADGYTWLVYLALDEAWCMTAMYDAQLQPVEWYFDISRRNFLDENGQPSMADLYLDLVLLPDGQVLMLDEDELLEAVAHGDISQTDADFAYSVFRKLSGSSWTDTAYLKAFCGKLLSEYTELLQNE